MTLVLRHASRILIVLLVGTFLSATLVRFAPGYGVGDEDLGSSLSAETREALRSSPEDGQSILAFYLDFYRQLARGDLGRSVSLQQPVSELLADRIPVTARSMAFGLLLAWMLGLACAAPSLFSQLRVFSALGSCLAALVLSTPAAVLALACLLARVPGRIAIGLVVFPRIYQFARNILLRAAASPHILTARAKGAGAWRVILRHILPSAATQLLALVGVSICLAFGASIPVEALCDIPGVGQLAWQAALSRDLTLLLDLTMIVTGITMAANSSMDIAAALLRENRP
jgi:peptide/nickel transport system permease protein